MSASQARRIALAAQGFADPQHASVTMRTIERALRRTGLLQVDSVNVLVRAQYLPLFSRIGPYETDLLRRAAEQPPRRLVEYWAHVKALMPVELWPHMRNRMLELSAPRRGWRWADVTPVRLRQLEERIASDGPITVTELDAERRSSSGWWTWSLTRRLAEILYRSGRIAVAGRNARFEPIYDIPDRVLPTEILNAPTPTGTDTARELTRRATRSLGVGTLADIADYYRMRQTNVTPAIHDLVDAGELHQVQVESWDQKAWLHRDARLPTSLSASALLSPFDPVMWHRGRVHRLFGFDYRLEMYTPRHQRQFGYHVLPFLHGEDIVARVDLKADRSRGLLLVESAHAETARSADICHHLAIQLQALASWLDLSAIRVGLAGDLARRLSKMVDSQFVEPQPGPAAPGQRHSRTARA